MRILLDTNLLIWGICEPHQLSARAREEISQAELIYVSSASVWEISIKVGLGKLTVNLEEMLSCLDKMNVQQLPISWEHSRRVQELPHYHRDPFDRMLIAQTISEPLILLTHDEILRLYTEELVHVV